VSPQDQGPPGQNRRPNADPAEKRPRIGLPMVLLAVLVVILAAQWIKDSAFEPKDFSELQQLIADGQVDKAEISTTHIAVTLHKAPGEETAKRYKTQLPAQSERLRERLAASLDEKGAKVRFDNTSGLFGDMMLWLLLPVVVLIFVFWFLMRRMGPPQGVMNFGKSKAKIYAEKEVSVTFGDVAGVDEAVEEVREIVEFLKEPKKFQALGARIPKGVLLLGAPGTGKTLLARAVAGEAGVPFFSLSGSDFVEMFVGVGASRVRDLFRQAEGQAPCLVFIDELDALGKTRGSSPISNDEREQTLNALLVEMDGFDANNGVIIIAATNRPEILDPALLRAGRFDRQIVVDRPDRVGRVRILQVHAKKVKLQADVDLEVIAKRTPGMVGADLANVINESALLAARRDKSEISLAELEEAIDRVMTGLERTRRGMTEREKEIVAAHETGHALVGYFTPGTDPVHRISIIPRGVGTGGHTLFLPEDERMLYTRDELIGRITALLGGRAAERVVYGHLSTGASNDLEVASRIARHMVTRYGMSDQVGPVSLEAESSQFLPGQMPTTVKQYGEEMQATVDGEVRTVIERSEKDALEILAEHREMLDKVRGILMEKEVIEGEEFLAIVNGKSPEPAEKVTT
jgi:cell division protease FtsH